MIAAPIIITADEINCLIYSYFQDSGFNHSAFALRNEGRLQNSPFFSKHIPRGELIDLLSKALLYLEVESHWRADGLTTHCKSGFSLLEQHVCSLEPPQDRANSFDDLPMDLLDSVDIPDSHSVSARRMNSSLSSVAPSHVYATSQPKDYIPTQNGSHALEKVASLRDTPLQSVHRSTDGSVKRKGSLVPRDGPVEKRARHDTTDMDIDTRSESPRPKTPSDFQVLFEPRVLSLSDIRPRGPGDLTTDPRVVTLLAGHQTEVFVCAFNPKMHNLLASGSKDSSVNVWDLPDPPPPNSTDFSEHPGEPLVFENASKAVQGDLTSLSWSPDGTLLAVGSYDSVLRVCTSTGSTYFSHPQHQGPIFATRFSESGYWLLSASLDGTTCLWDVREKRLHKQYRCHKDCCLDVAWINENTFASAGADMRIFVMRVDEDEPIKTLNGHKDEVNMIRANPSGTRLASCSDDGTACIWRVDNISHGPDAIPGLSTSDPGVVLKGHGHSVSTVGWCVDHPAGTNELVATSSFDGSARLWDTVTGECLHVYKEHKAPLYALTFSPDGKFLATGSADGWLHLYHTKSYVRIWSWFAGIEKPGVFEIDWQEAEGINRIAMALECHQVGVLDVNKLDAFRSLIQNTAARIEV